MLQYNLNFTLPTLIILCVGCGETEKPIHSDNPAEILKSVQEKIREDLADGISHPNTIEVDESKLPPIKWVAERGHSSISFYSRHWEIVDLMGWFEEFEAVMYSDDEAFSNTKIFAKVNAASIVMPNFKMAETLNNADYLNTKTYSEIRFESTFLNLTQPVSSK